MKHKTAQQTDPARSRPKRGRSTTGLPNWRMIENRDPRTMRPGPAAGGRMPEARRYALEDIGNIW